MNLPIFTPVKTFISRGVWVLGFTLMAGGAWAQGWKVDFSRRTPAQATQVHSEPQGRTPSSSSGFLASLRGAADPIQDIVILNTEKGFVPGTLFLHVDQSYKIHVVNVNEKNKNVSFIMDAFSQHHGTYYGQIRSFVIRPTQSGIVTFQSPETSAQGRVVIRSSEGETPVDLRLPASR